MTNTETTTTTAAESFVAYGPVATGGKIHRTTNGNARCLEQKGVTKPLLSFLTKIDTTWAAEIPWASETNQERFDRYDAMRQHEIDALNEAKIPGRKLCVKCCFAFHQNNEMDLLG